MAKTVQQQQQQIPPMPMEHDDYWGNVNNPEWRRQQRARVAAQQAQRQADLAWAQQMEAQRQAEREKEQAEHQAFLQAAQKRREAFARGEIGPVDPKTLPNLAAVFEPSKLAAQAAKEEEQRRINESVRWPGLPLQERLRREKYELVNHCTWPE